LDTRLNLMVESRMLGPIPIMIDKSGEVGKQFQLAVAFHGQLQASGHRHVRVPP
jgi:hypothetical protein